ncbi:RluA family pseudouridine synthase [bacterium]|nr:RluA family pseudouridine synthase [bacterium]
MSESDGDIKHFNNSEIGLLSEILHKNLSLNFEEFKNLLKFGAIYVNSERQEKDKTVQANATFRVHTKPRRYNCDYPWSSLIIYENDFFLILNKPSGIPSHPSIDNAIENSLTQVSLARKYPLYVTHRLDTLTSGLIVYAKKQAFAKTFNVQMQKRGVRKKYVALVESAQKFPEMLTHYMNPVGRTPKELTDKMNHEWQVCELGVLEQKKISPELTWLKLNLLTGRTHQIRAQLSFMQAPILGDALYGSKMPFKKDAIALRSCEIEFTYNDERMKFNISEDFEL